MACFGALHDAIRDPGEVPAAVEDLDAFVLGGLGYATAVTR
jgi:hypothetical protein